MRKVLAWIGGFFLVLILAAAIMDSGSSAKPGLDSQQNSVLDQSDDAVVETIPPGIQDGTYVVGEDIKPGRYKSRGGELCYWERQRDDNGGIDSIISNSLSPGPQVVTIKKADYAFETRGCGPWKRQ